MGGLRYLKAATGDGVLEHRVWTLDAWHHNGLVHGFQHRQIIGGVAKPKHRNIGLLQMLFEHLHRAALMAAATEQMAHAIALHHQQLMLGRELPQRLSQGFRGGEKWNAPFATLR